MNRKEYPIFSKGHLQDLIANIKPNDTILRHYPYNIRGEML